MRAQDFTNVGIMRLDLETDPLPDSRFDLIVSSMTMHHIEHPSSLFAKFFELLTPGGTLCIADLDPDGGEFHQDNVGVKHFGFDREQIAADFSAAGFADIETSTAYTIRREVQDKGTKEFTVFLVSGVKSV